MTLNPDDLLIFKTREEEAEAESAKKQKKTAAPEERKAVVQQKAKQQKPAKQKPEQVQKEKPQIQEEESYFIAPPEETTGTPNFAEQAIMVSGEESEGEKLGKRRKVDSREIASHMNCELHPWRRAYALCNYCKRAFCYEDIIESGGKYYCFDDIEKVPESVRKSQLVKYNNLGYVAALFYIAAFGVFIYYSHTSTLALIVALAQGSHGALASGYTAGTFLTLGEIVFAFTALVSGFFILIGADGGFKISALSSILGVLVFSYQYINLGSLYLAMVPALLFVAFVLLSYSRVAYETVSEEGFVESGPSTNVARSGF